MMIDDCLIQPTSYILHSYQSFKMQALMQQLQNGGASRRQMQSGETILADK